MNSFFPDSIRSWNNIGVTFCSASSIAIFKKNIFGLIRPNPRPLVFTIPRAYFLFLLRLGLSPLKWHKKRHNFADTPNDWCDCRSAPEDTSHFLLFCNLHDLPRVALRTSVSYILFHNNLQGLSDNIELYLYGHPSLSLIENKNIVLSTIKFIKDSNRNMHKTIKKT